MKVRTNSFYLFCGFLLLTFCFSCKSPKTKIEKTDSVTENILKRKTSFDSFYFQNNSTYHFILKIKYAGGNYELNDARIFKVPGPYRNVPSQGNLTVKFLDGTNAMLNDSIKTIPPYKFIREKINSGDTTGIINADTVVFNLSLPGNASVRKVVFFEDFIQKSVITVPINDTFDLIKINKNAPLDTTLF